MAKTKAKKPAQEEKAAAPRPEGKPPKLLRMELTLSQVDTEYADRVRAARDDGHVDRLATAYENAGPKDPVRPIEVYNWPGGKYLCADGGYRVRALAKLGRKKVNAEIWVCESEDDARRRAFTRAAIANDDHRAMPRSSPDKRVITVSAMTDPMFRESSDRALSELLRINKQTVKKVRVELSENGTIGPDDPAHAAKHYKELRKPTPPQPSSSAPASSPDPAPAPSAVEPGPVARPEGTADGAEPEAAKPAGMPRSFPVADLEGPSPDLKAELANAGITTAGDLADAIDAGGRWGLDDDALAGLCEVLQDVPTPGEPYSRCPHIGPDGFHRAAGSCKVCKGRNTITRGHYLTLPDELRTHCTPGQTALPEPEKEAGRATGTAPPKVTAPKGERDVEVRAASEAFDGLLRDIRAVVARLNMILPGRGGYLLRDVTVGGKPLFVKRPVKPGSAEMTWACPLLDFLTAAARRTRPARVCAGCKGAGCGACGACGFVPDDADLIRPKDGAAALEFGAPWEGES